MIAARKSAGSRKRRDRNTVALRVHRIPSRSDLVADAPDRDDRRGLAQLAPELADVDVDRARVTRKGVPPDTLEELIARENETTVVEELPEQVELLRRELN